MVVGRARAEEDRRPTHRAHHLEVEGLLVEVGGRLGVAHVEDGMVESLHRDHAVRNPLSRSTIPGNAPRNASMSASVEFQPTLARNERSASTPIAASTGDGFERLARARRARVDRHAVLVEGEEDRLGFDARDPEAHEVGEAIVRRHRSARRRARTPASRARAAASTRARASASRSKPATAQLRRGDPESDDRRYVLDAATARPLLRAAQHERREAQTPPNQQRARALRAAELVRSDRAKVGAQRRRSSPVRVRPPRTRRRGR